MLGPRHEAAQVYQIACPDRWGVLWKERKKVLERPWVCWGGSVASTRGLCKPSEVGSFRTPASTKKKKMSNRTRRS